MIENNVQLPDEYDSIFHDLEPFWGIEPHELVRLRDELETRADSYTLGKINGTKIGVVNHALNNEHLIKNSEPVVRLLGYIDEFLPPFRAVFSPHDSPGRLSDYGVKSAALRAAHNSSCMSSSNLSPFTDLKPHCLAIERGHLPMINNIGWLAACPPSSPARSTPITLDAPPSRPSQKTFIHDHRLSMDPCLHPDLFYHHGEFLSQELGPTPRRELVPLFSFCSTTVHQDVRVPSTYGWVEEPMGPLEDPDWDDRLEERLGWRGANTGIWHGEGMRWRESHRASLVRFANALNGTTRVLLPTKSDKDRVGASKEMRNGRLNPGMFDVSFAGEPLGCDGSSECEVLRTAFRWEAKQNLREAGKYRYILDVCSPPLALILSMC